MQKLLLIVVAFALFLAACSGSGTGGVASLEESGDSGAVVEEETGDAGASDEDLILAFSACMRENGVENFEDPDFNADGSVGFNRGELGDVDPETVRAAFQACQSNLEGLAFGRGSGDFTEIEDRLLEFAGCMRDNGYDMPDPDFSNLGPGGGGVAPFGEDGVDPEDPVFQSALGACEHIFEGFAIGGRGGPGAGRGGDG